MKLDPDHIGENPAARLHEVFSAARNYSVKLPAMEVWSQLFEFQESDPIKRARLVTNALHYLQDELAAAELAIEREKLHFLNPVLVRRIHDRWIDKYTEPWAALLSGLKDDLEGELMEKVFEIYIKTTPERLWQAITDPAMRAKYTFGVGVFSDWTPGSSYQSRTTELNGEAGMPIGEGENLEVDPPRRLVQTFRALWSDEVKAEGFTRVSWDIEPVADSCRLTVTHDQLRAGANDELYGGWPMVLSGLKTLLETGETLTTPGSLMYLSPQQVSP